MLLSRSKNSTKSFEYNNKQVMFLPKDYKPCAFDILCGRGRSHAKHPGNKMFSEIVKRNILRYVQGRNRTNRRIIVEYIVEFIEQQGFRFIKVDPETHRYYQLDSDAVHEKTGHAIRDLIKLNGSKEKAILKIRGVSPIPCSSLLTPHQQVPPIHCSSPCKVVSPDSQEEKQEGWCESPSSTMECCIEDAWPSEQFSSSLLHDEQERATLANLAMSIELRQFPDTAAMTAAPGPYHHNMDLENRFSKNASTKKFYSSGAGFLLLNSRPSTTIASSTSTEWLAPLTTTNKLSQEQEHRQQEVCDFLSTLYHEEDEDQDSFCFQEYYYI